MKANIMKTQIKYYLIDGDIRSPFYLNINFSAIDLFKDLIKFCINANIIKT